MSIKRQQESSHSRQHRQQVLQRVIEIFCKEAWMLFQTFIKKILSDLMQIKPLMQPQIVQKVWQQPKPN